MRTFIALIWFALAAWFVWGTDSSRSAVLGEIATSAHIDPADIDRDACRAVLPNPPEIKLGGVMQKCSDCHSLFESGVKSAAEVLQHREIVHDHGMNDACFNCHSQKSHNKLVLRDGEEIEFIHAERLCSQCHGTVYRDWQVGGHGKTRGSWDAASGKQWRLTCIQCHDPHAPAFGPMKLLPGPNTWRMGPVGEPHGREAMERNPLERWKLNRINEHQEEKH